MNIGVPRERRPDEHRVGLTPTRVEMLTRAGHRCYVEHSAGLGAGFQDDAYVRAGAQIVYSPEEVFGRADLVIKVARPTAEEGQWLRPGQVIMAFWHLATASSEKLQRLRDHRITAIAYEMIRNDDGSAPILRPMSQIAGRMSAHIAAGLLQNNYGGRGVLLGGLPGVPPAEVVILGAGTAGMAAARAFTGLGASVYILDRDVTHLERVFEHEQRRVTTMMAHRHNIEKVVKFADVVVGAVLIPGARTPVLVTREMVRTMRRRAVILDIDIDQGGSIETARPTTHQTPTYLAEDVIHFCVPNLAGVLGRTASHALAIATWPYVHHITEHGLDTAITHSSSLQRGVAIRDGDVVALDSRPEVSL